MATVETRTYALADKTLTLRTALETDASAVHEAFQRVRVQLEVAATNTRAIQLYRAFGFETEGRLRAQRKHGDTFVDTLVMARLRPGLVSIAGE